MCDDKIFPHLTQLHFSTYEQNRGMWSMFQVSLKYSKYLLNYRRIQFFRTDGLTVGKPTVPSPVPLWTGKGLKYHTSPKFETYQDYYAFYFLRYGFFLSSRISVLSTYKTKVIFHTFFPLKLCYFPGLLPHFVSHLPPCYCKSSLGADYGMRQNYIVLLSS